MFTDPCALRGSLAHSRRVFLAGLGWTVLGTAGCRLGRESAPRRTFALQVPTPGRLENGADVGQGGAEEKARVGVLMVRPFRVAAIFDSRAMVIRRSDAEYVSDPYNGFLTSPGALLTEAVAGWVRGLGVFAVVSTGGSQLTPTHALEGEATELCGDYRDPAHPQAVLAIQFRLLHPLGGSATRVRWQREARRAIPLERAGAEALVAGWNRALGEICALLGAESFRGTSVPPGSQARWDR